MILFFMCLNAKKPLLKCQPSKNTKSVIGGEPLRPSFPNGQPWTKAISDKLSTIKSPKNEGFRGLMVISLLEMSLRFDSSTQAG